MNGARAEYALIGGAGLFTAYPQQPPFLMRWFPSYKGSAMSAYFLFFGSGQLLALMQGMQKQGIHTRKSATEPKSPRGSHGNVATCVPCAIERVRESHCERSV